MVTIQDSHLVLGALFLVVFLLLFFIVGMFLVILRRGKKARKKAKKVTVQQKAQRILVQQPLITESEEQVQTVKSADVLKLGKSKFSFRFWKEWWWNRKNASSIVMINMELVNGFHKVFLALHKDEGFKHNGKKYLFDNESKYFVIDAKMWAFDYHETFSLPIRRVIPVNAIRKTIEKTGLTEVEYATNPSTLERFAVSKIAEGIMRGAELDKVFKFLKLMVIIILTVVVIHLLLYAQNSGFLSQLPTV